MKGSFDLCPQRVATHRLQTADLESPGDRHLGLSVREFLDRATEGKTQHKYGQGPD